MNPYDIDSTEQLRRIMLAQQEVMFAQLAHIHALQMKLKSVESPIQPVTPAERRAFFAWKGIHEKE